MRPIFICLVIIPLCFNCGEQQPEFKRVSLMKTITTQENGNRATRDSVSYLTSKFFRIDLYRIDSNRYHAEIGIEKPKSLETFKVSYLRIINEDSTILPFKGPEEFMEFMRVRGYIMIHQKKFELYNDYVFARVGVAR